MLEKNEKSLLNFIKFVPILFIILISLIITYFLILDNKNKYEEEITKLSSAFIKSNKEEVKNRVYTIYDFIEFNKQKSEKELKILLKQKVNEAYSIANNIYKQNINKEKKQILKMIKDALREIRFNENRGYFFIHDIYGNNQLYPVDKSKEGLNYYDVKDIHGYTFIKKIVETIKNKTDNFDEYYWSKPSDKNKKIHKKISYYKAFAPLNISIGTGEYLEDFEEELKAKTLEYINKLNNEKDKYIFIIDNKGNLVAHLNKSLINTNLLNLKDIDNFYLVKQMIKISQNYEGFITYNTTKKNNHLLVEGYKTSYIKYFEPWGWTIGTGFYKSELRETINEKKKQLEKENNEYIKNIILFSIFLTIVFILISTYLSIKIENSFNSYKRRIFNEIEENRKKDILIAQQSKLASMGEMIGNIAHQWRQPLSMISTLASGVILQKEFNTLKDKELIESMESITKSTQYLSKTIDDFKNFFNPNKDKNSFNSKKFIEKAIRLVDAQFKNKNIKIIKDVEEFDLNSLENELIQVILNILNNSRDEFEKNQQENKLIFIKLFKENGNLNIKIKDNAKGIDEKIINRIFEPYFTTKHKAQGTGIGLYMSREIIFKHLNGQIKVSNVHFEYENRKEKGALFEIIIPLEL